MTEKIKRKDGREAEQTRETRAEIGVVPRADGSALFAFGDSVAIASVYGPRPLYPQHLQNPRQGLLRCYYDLLSFSVGERKKPGPSRRSTEISQVITWALSPVVKLAAFPNTVIDVYINILQADASTRCAAINAASLALAHAGIPMSCLVSSVSMGKVKNVLVVDLTKEEEDEKDSVDIPIAFASDKITLLQLDGIISPEELKKSIKIAYKVCKEILGLQIKTLKAIKEK